MMRLQIMNRLNKTRKFLRQSWFPADSTLVDRTIFRLFAVLNAMGKLFSSQGFKEWLYHNLTEYLLQPLPYESSHPLQGTESEHSVFWEYKRQRLLETLQPGDVLLVRGNQRISRIIQTLTRSPYSHAAFYIGDGKIVEADPVGVLVSSIEKYLLLDLRICRPTMITPEKQHVVMQHMLAMVKRQPQYDITNIENLLFKYIYVKFRPDLHVYIGGSTKFENYYICSGMIAHGFHKAGYPIVPTLRFRRSRKKGFNPMHLTSTNDYFQWVTYSRKNYSQIVPGDFDESSFFTSIKFLFQDYAPVTKRSSKE